jgi:transposase-like protein
MAAVLKSSMTDISSSSPEDVTEGARRATEDTSSGAAPPDPEVAASAKRRQYSSAEKRRILAEADRCTKPGEIGALMRREGIYSSHLSTWRRQRAQAERAALAPQKRGPKPDPQARQIEHLHKDNARLRRKLERAELIIEAQKKLCVALGLPTADDRGEDE